MRAALAFPVVFVVAVDSPAREIGVWRQFYTDDFNAKDADGLGTDTLHAN